MIHVYFPMVEPERSLLVAPSTLEVFDGVTPAEHEASLVSTRKKKDIIQRMKVEQMPHGTGLEGESISVP